MKNLFVVVALTVGALSFGAPAATRTVTEATKEKAVVGETVREHSASHSTTSAVEGGAGQISEAINPGTTTELVGDLDLRPSYGISGKEFHTENGVELGFKPSKDSQLSVHQDFNTNLSNPGAPDKGFDFTVKDAFVRYKLNNIWKNKSGLSFSFEPRVYLPTEKVKREAGMITFVRNYFKLTQEFSPTFSVTVMDALIPHIYTKGAGLRSGVMTANDAFENRFYIVADVNFTDKLSFSLPFIFEQHRHASAAGAALSGVWESNVWIYPELLYSVTPNTQVGLSYYSDNLMKADFSGFTITDGLKGGAPQLVLRASL